MAEPAGTTRPKTKTILNTQFDREMIVAARDDKIVLFFFTTESVMRDAPDLSGKVVVVDRYMVKVRSPETHEDDIWIQKSHLAGVVIQ